MGYSSATYERAYFEFSRLNADIEATVKQRGAGEGRDVQQSSKHPDDGPAFGVAPP
jgi:hypothetical protein